MILEGIVLSYSCRRGHCYFYTKSFNRPHTASKKTNVQSSVYNSGQCYIHVHALLISIKAVLQCRLWRLRPPEGRTCRETHITILEAAHCTVQEVHYGTEQCRKNRGSSKLYKEQYVASKQHSTITVHYRTRKYRARFVNVYVVQESIPPAK
jgi:hypothetical protein